MVEALADNIHAGSSRSRSYSASRRRAHGLNGRGGSVSMKDLKVVDLSLMEDNNRFTTAYSLSPANTNKSKSTATTDLSSSFEERRVNRSHDHIHKQQRLGDKRHEQKKQIRVRPRSLSRPRDRKPTPITSSSVGRDGKATNVTSNSSMDSSLNRAKALLEQMEQKQKNKTYSSRGRTRSPPPRGRSKSRTRTRPSDTEKSMSNISRQTQQSRPSQQQYLNQNQRQKSSRSRSLNPPPISKSQVRQREKSEDRRRWSDWDNKNEDKRRWSETKYKHSLSKSFTTISRGERRGKIHSEKEVKEDTQASKSTPQMRRSPPKHSPKGQKNHQRDYNQVRGRDGKSSPPARQRSKSLTRSKSNLSVQRQNPKSKNHVRPSSMSPRHRQDRHPPSSLSRDKDVTTNTAGHQNTPKVDKNGCCIHHPFVQLRKRKENGEWTILARVCAMCNKKAHDQRRNTAEQDSFVFIPGGMTEELPRRNIVQTSMEKLDSVPSMTRIESALTVSVLGSDEGSAPFADVQKGEDDNTSANPIVGNNRQQSIYRRSITSQSENKPHKMLHDKLMFTKTSLLEHNSISNADNTMRVSEKEKEEVYTNKESLRVRRSSRKNEPDEFRMDMTKVESALHFIRSQTPPRSRPPPDTVDSRILRTPPPRKNTPERSTPMRQHQPQQLSHVPPPPPPPPYNFGHSLAVLNPDPEPEWIETDYQTNPVTQYNPAQMYHSPNQHSTHAYSQQMHLPTQSPDYFQHSNQHALPEKESEWRKYVVKSSARQDEPKKRERRRSKTSAIVPDKLSNHDIRTHVVVKNMPFTDNQGDSGIYSGQVNEHGHPEGKGSMKYNNGIFYEGMWTGGSQDERSVSQYNRIRGGFTSWGGKGKVAVKSGRTMPWNATKIDKNDENDTTNVRGMEWVDRNGDWGRYTGEVNKDNIPHGKGIMKYSFGLIAEGDWVCGVLKENPQDRLIAAASLASHGGASVVSGARSLGIGGGMSVGPGMSIGGGVSLGTGISLSQRPPVLVGSGISVGQGSMYGGSFSQTMIMQTQTQPQQNMAQQHAMIAQQSMNGGGSVHKSQIPINQQQMAPVQDQNYNSDQNGHPPPIFEITLG